MAWTRSAIVTDHARHQHARLDRHGLVHHALLLGVVADLDVADQREVLAERMTHETVIGEDAAQIRVTFKHDAVQVECFALEPVHARPDAGQRRHHRQRVVFAEDAQTQAMVVLERKQMDHGGETAWLAIGTRAIGPGEAAHGLAFHAAGEAGTGNGLGIPLGLAVAHVINAAHVDRQAKAERCLVAQGGSHRKQVGGSDLGGHFVAYAADRQRFAESRGKALGQRVRWCVSHGRLRPQERAMVLVRRIFFCSCRMPWINASAVGGQPGT